MFGVHANIIVGCGTGIWMHSESGTELVSCNDVWNNGTNWYGTPDLVGINGNFSEDPIFCDPENGDYSVAESSTCLPGQGPVGCGLIGALDAGCEGPVPTREIRWGRLRLLYQ